MFGSKKKEKIFTWDNPDVDYANLSTIEEPDLDALIAGEAEISWVDTEAGCVMVTRPISSRIASEAIAENNRKEFVDTRKLSNRKNEGTAQPTSPLIQHIEGSATLPVEVLAWILVNQHTDLDADYPQSTVKKTKGGSAGDKVSSEGRGPNQNNPSSLDALRLDYRRENEEMWINWKRAISKINV